MRGVAQAQNAVEVAVCVNLAYIRSRTMATKAAYIRGAEIARGGMGAVLEARDPTLGRTVAMKVILARGADPAERERFVQEARVLGELEHPNIVPIHDLGKDEQGRDYYTMKLVQGTTLNDILIRIARGDRETLQEYSLNALLTIFQKVCDAIAFAHSRGIIHRDLKPQNIMVGAFGEVLVMDWGLAKVVDTEFTSFFRRSDVETGPTGTVVMAQANAAPPSKPDEDVPTMVEGSASLANDLPTMAESEPLSGDLPTVADAPNEDRTIPPQTQVGALSQSQLTMEGAVMGTPNFMSPEQAEGRISELDARSDVFSLGGVLYTILTLRPPVSGSSMEEILGKVRAGTIVEPTLLNANAPSLLDKARASLISEVADAATAESLPHCPGGKVPRRLSGVVMKALKRDLGERYQSVGEFSADITAYQNGFATSAEDAGLLTLMRLFINRHRTIAGALAIGIVMAVFSIIQILASERRATAEADRATAAEQVAVDALGIAESEREAQRRAFARAQTALGEAAIRELDGLRARSLLGAVPEDLRDADWRYLHARADGSTAVLRGVTTPPVLGIEPVSALASVFAVADASGRASLVDARNGKELLSFPTIFGTNVQAPFSLAFSKANGELAIANWEDERVAFYHALSGQKLRDWKAGRPWLVEFHPTRGQLLFSPEPVAGQAVQLRLYDAESGTPLWAYDPGVDWMLAAFTPDGNSVVVALGQNAAVLLDAQTGREVSELPPTGPLVYRVAISPDGELAAFGDGQGGVTVTSLADGQMVTQFRAGENIIRLLAFTPDGGRLVTLTYPPNQSFHHARVWDAYTGHALQSMLGVSDNSKNAAVHPYSGELVIAGEETKAWPLGQLPPSWVIDSGINPPRARFWPDGDSLLANDVSGRPRLVSLHEDGSVSTNWTSPIACGRDAVLAVAPGSAVIGGATFDLAANIYFHLRHDGTQVAPPLMWQAPEPLPWLALDDVGERAWSGGGLLAPGDGQSLAAHTNLVMNLELGVWMRTNRLLGVTQVADASVLTLIDAITGQSQLQVTNSTPIFVLATTPDHKLVLEGGWDKIVRVRDAETLSVLRRFRVHDAALTALAIHPRKPWIATASEDLTIRLWNLESGDLLEELRGPPSPASDLHFSPDGTRLVSAGANGVALVWEPLTLRAPQ